jgi:hypothetical protein
MRGSLACRPVHRGPAASGTIALLRVQQQDFPDLLTG